MTKVPICNSRATKLLTSFTEEETKKMLKTSDNNEYAHAFLTSIISGVKIEETADGMSRKTESSQSYNKFLT